METLIIVNFESNWYQYKPEFLALLHSASWVRTFDKQIDTFHILSIFWGHRWHLSHLSIGVNLTNWRFIKNVKHHQLAISLSLSLSLFKKISMLSHSQLQKMNLKGCTEINEILRISGSWLQWILGILWKLLIWCLVSLIKLWRSLLSI